MARKFNRKTLLEAFDRIAEEAVKNGEKLELAVYGGSALMLASRFRYATEDVDIASIDGGFPVWLEDIIKEIASKNNWSDDWVNDAVDFHLSKIADRHADHVEFSTFYSNGKAGLSVYVPSAGYMLALKLKAVSRVNDVVKGKRELSDIQNLIIANGIKNSDEAIDLLGKFFPKSAMERDKYVFFLKHIWPEEEQCDAPEYPIPGR